MDRVDIMTRVCYQGNLEVSQELKERDKGDDRLLQWKGIQYTPKVKIYDDHAFCWKIQAQETGDIMESIEDYLT